MFLLLLLCSIVIIAGCKTISSESKTVSEEMFVTVEYCDLYIVVYNRYTKEMYAISNGNYNRGTFTLLVNSDGSPMLYEEINYGY